MPNLAYAGFVPLAKADAAQRLVYGYIDETPDRAKEVLDYETSKPYFQEWSDSFVKATDGKSAGNVRAQHGKVVAGKLEKMAFDDVNKRIEFCAKIVDDNEWKKVEAGVYTGFSPGGRYAKRWADPVHAGHLRYTAAPSELSIVDIPCLPSATFTMVKADGAEVETEFVLDKAYEPGNEATKARAEEMTKAAEGTTYKDHVVKARADLIAENAAEALAKMASDPETTETKPDVFSALEAALAKADAAVATIGDDVLADDPATAMAKGLEQIAVVLADKPLIKGLRGIQSLAGVIYQVVAVQAACKREADDEGDGSPVPAQIATGIATLCDALVAMAKEETAELMADMMEAGMEEAVPDWSMYECAAPIVDMIKADTALMEKAGKRHSKSDMGHIQGMHDSAVKLGAVCGAEKVAPLAEMNERLTKAVDSALPRIEKLAEELANTVAARDADREEMAQLRKELDRLGAAPAPTRLQLAISKEEDNGTLAKDADETPESTLETIGALTGRERSAELEKFVINARAQQYAAR